MRVSYYRYILALGPAGLVFFLQFINEAIFIACVKLAMIIAPFIPLSRLGQINRQKQIFFCGYRLSVFEEKAQVVGHVGAAVIITSIAVSQSIFPSESILRLFTFPVILIYLGMNTYYQHLFYLAPKTSVPTSLGIFSYLFLFILFGLIIFSAPVLARPLAYIFLGLPLVVIIPTYLRIARDTFIGTENFWKIFINSSIGVLLISFALFVSRNVVNGLFNEKSLDGTVIANIALISNLVRLGMIGFLKEIERKVFSFERIQLSREATVIGLTCLSAPLFSLIVSGRSIDPENLKISYFLIPAALLLTSLYCSQIVDFHYVNFLQKFLIGCFTMFLFLSHLAGIELFLVSVLVGILGWSALKNA